MRYVSFLLGCGLLILLITSVFLPYKPASSTLPAAEEQLLGLINDYRLQNPFCAEFDARTGAWSARPWQAGDRKVLEPSASLTTAAFNHNNYMLANRCAGHKCPGEASLGDRVLQAGYSSSYVFENIHFGYELATGAFNGWKNSSCLADPTKIRCGHNEAMLSCSAKAVGLHRIFIPQPNLMPEGYRLPYYWTAVFGRVLETQGESVELGPQRCCDSEMWVSCLAKNQRQADSGSRTAYQGIAGPCEGA